MIDAMKQSFQKKRKTVTLDIPASTEQDKTNSLTKRNNKQAKVTLDEIEKQFAQQIDDHLKYSLIELLIFKLTSFANKGKLFELVKHNNFHLFDWVIENCNLNLMNYLFEHLSNHDCFIMLCHNDYASIKKLIEVSVQSEWSDVVEKVVPILKTIFKIQPNWQALEIIQNCLWALSLHSNSNTIKNLQAWITTHLDHGDKASLITEYKGSFLNSQVNVQLPEKLYEQQVSIKQTDEESLPFEHSYQIPVSQLSPE
jgi:hypothetical protein